jgi:hypothetical protein
MTLPAMKNTPHRLMYSFIREEPKMLLPTASLTIFHPKDVNDFKL